MKNFLYLSALIFLCSCNSEKKETNQTVIQTPNGLDGLQKNVSAPAAQSVKSNLIFNPPHGETGHTCALAVGAPLNQNATPQQPLNNTQTQAVNVPVPVNINGKNLNPKHGEPGHKCDIAVGAPLDSKPAQVVQTSTPQPTVITQNTNVKVGKGLNPPHGQPNHRCDIAVGAPLNSKPAAQPSTGTVQTPEIKTAEITPSETQNGVKLNPKHGEPGHRCDIAVGAPLT